MHCLHSFSQSIHVLYVVETITLVYHKHFQGEKTKPVLILAYSGITLSEMNLSL